MTRVLVCGGHNYTNADRIFKVLDRAVQNLGLTVLIHGAARGADSIADGWAKLHEVEVIAFPADFKRYGKTGGPIRNTQMITEGKPDICIAFPGGWGTDDMVKKAREAGLKVYEIDRL